MAWAERFPPHFAMRLKCANYRGRAYSAQLARRMAKKSGSSQARFVLGADKEHNDRPADSDFLVKVFTYRGLVQLLTTEVIDTFHLEVEDPCQISARESAFRDNS